MFFLFFFFLYNLFLFPVFCYVSLISVMVDPFYIIIPNLPVSQNLFPAVPINFLTFRILALLREGFLPQSTGCISSFYPCIPERIFHAHIDCPHIYRGLGERTLFLEVPSNTNMLFFHSPVFLFPLCCYSLQTLS